MDKAGKRKERKIKRIGNLWEKIISFPNIYKAAKKAQKAKRFCPNVLSFNYSLEKELVHIRQSLVNKTYNPGEYKTFCIFEPKRRLISAAPYRDRVVHHALCNVIEPVFDSTFIRDSYSNRKGYGTHKALNRFKAFYHLNKYILQCDIQKYFPSIDHEILKEIIRQKIKCKDTLWLIELIIDNSNEQEPLNHCFHGDDLLSRLRRRGIPIGNLTSQFFANIYLNPFDHFVKENLKAKYYIRYVDDFAIFNNDKTFLFDCRKRIEEFLEHFRLKIHPVKSQLFQCKVGASFLGFRFLRDRIKVKSENLRRARRRLKRMRNDYKNWLISVEDVSRSISSWVEHLKYGDTWKLREKIFSELVFVRA
mgnify:CR=1 FL=1